ncbi:hypothetical protein ACFL5O_10700 [Myxococcota bacterium]
MASAWGIDSTAAQVDDYGDESGLSQEPAQQTRIRLVRRPPEVVSALAAAAEESLPGPAQVTQARPLPAPSRSVIELPVRASPAGRFLPRARWEGVVEEVRDDEFDARLVDIMGDEPDISVTFPVDDLSCEDVRLLKSGAVFYWIIGYREDATGQRSRIAVVKFRRLPARRSEDLEKAKLEAEAIRSELGL